MKEMSVTGFYEKFRSAPLGTLQSHFDVLEEYGWLRFVRSVRGKPGRPQRVYRATELAFYDDETAAELPLSVRTAFSLRILQQMGERAAGALIANTVEARADRFMYAECLELDERGWTEALQVLADCFFSLAHEQTDAKIRLRGSARKATLMMISLAAFESPQIASSSHVCVANELGEERPATNWDSGLPLETRVGKLCRDPVSVRILKMLDNAVMSPGQFGPVADLSYRQLERKCEKLERLGWAEKIKNPNGGTRRVYRATAPPTNLDLRAQVPRRHQDGAAWEVLSDFFDRALDAIRAKTLDRRPERHLTWTPVLVDDIGWAQIIRLLNSAETSLQLIHKRSENQDDSPSAQIPITTLLSAFPIPSGG